MNDNHKNVKIINGVEQNMNTCDFPAHTREENGHLQIQSVKEHNYETAYYAEKALKKIDLGNAAYLAGLVHDGGKMKREFRDYILFHNKPEGSVNHTFFGTRYLLELFHTQNEGKVRFEDISSEILAYAAGAHHGLFDCINSLKRNGFTRRINQPDIYYEEAKSNFDQECVKEATTRNLFENANKQLIEVMKKCNKMASRNRSEKDELNFYLGLLTRLILSAVIEGDRQSTIQFIYPSIQQITDDQYTPDWQKCLSQINNILNSYPGDTDIQKTRKLFSEICYEAGKRKPGIYRLYLPTGAGKTLSSLRYAVSHASFYKKKRIIFTSPLLSIIDQNALVIKNIVGDTIRVLEHHSNVLREENSTEDSDELTSLIMDNWNCPIIITTFVQLLNTFFGGKTSQIRRFNALSDSIIVIDEVQTLPVKMLSMFYLCLNFLSEVCGTTVILCSATQPCRENVRHPLLREAEDIVPMKDEYLKPFKRNAIINLGKRKLEEIPALILSEYNEVRSLLVVCNKREEASFLVEELIEKGISVFHLSAAMCIQHRRDVVTEIQQCLKQHRKIICVSTQVIEAGVDISFERVIRFQAGMDSIVQSAGRCNRNGELKGVAQVGIINCIDENLSRLSDIRDAKNATEELLAEYDLDPDAFDNDLGSDKSITYYYQTLYRNMKEKAQDYSIQKGITLFDLLSTNRAYADTDAEQNDLFYMKQAFAEANKAFEVFDEDTETILVPYAAGEKYIEQLCGSEAADDPLIAQKLLEECKAYTVSVYRYQFRRLLQENGVYTSLKNRIYILRKEFYDEVKGITIQENKLDFLEV